MRNFSSIFCILLSLALAGPLCAERTTDWETLPVAPHDDEISEWWTNTWHPGDVVSMVSRYQFEGRLCVRKQNVRDVRWFELVKRFLEAEQAVRIDGVARCTTTVLDAPDGGSSTGSARPTQLLRAFHACPISTRAAGVIGLKDGVKVEESARKALVKFYAELQSPEAQEAMDVSIEYASKIAGLAAEAAVWSASGAAAAVETVTTGGAAAPAAGAQLAATGAAGEAARKLTNLAVQWAGRKAKEYGTDKIEELRTENLKALKGARFGAYGDSDVRGAEVKQGSWFYKKLDKSDADGIVNIAVELNNLFNNGRFYLAGMPGATIFAKRLLDADGDDGEARRVFVDGIGDLASLPEKMQDVPLTPSDYRVSNIFARETLDVNATLFDLRRREVGDVWRADGALLNNFLHPDLEGRFEGTIFLKYENDEPQSLVSFPETKDKVFQTRRLTMLPRYMGKPSRLSYRESVFRMDYDPETQDAGVSIWVDKATGHVVKVSACIEGNAHALPKLALFKGFSLYDSTGRLHFEMSAEANPVRVLPDIAK